MSRAVGSSKKDPNSWVKIGWSGQNDVEKKFPLEIKKALSMYRVENRTLDVKSKKAKSKDDEVLLSMSALFSHIRLHSDLDFIWNVQYLKKVHRKLKSTDPSELG